MCCSRCDIRVGDRREHVESRRASGRVEEALTCTPGRWKTISAATLRVHRAVRLEPTRIRSHDDRVAGRHRHVTLDRANKAGMTAYLTPQRLMPLAYSTFTILFPGGGNTGHAVGTNIYMVVGLTGVYIPRHHHRHRHRFRLRVHRQLGQLGLDKTTGRIIMVGPTTAGRPRCGSASSTRRPTRYSTAITIDLVPVERRTPDPLPDQPHLLLLRPHLSDPHRHRHLGQHHHHDPNRAPPRLPHRRRPGRIQRLGVGTVF